MRVVRGSEWPARYCTSSNGTFCSSRSVTVVTRNECGEKCPGSPALFSRRILPQVPLQIVPHRDRARLAAFLREAERVLRPVVLEALEGQLGHGADAGGGVGKDREHGAVP